MKQSCNGKENAVWCCWVEVAEGEEVEVEEKEEGKEERKKEEDAIDGFSNNCICRQSWVYGRRHPSIQFVFIFQFQYLYFSILWQGLVYGGALQWAPEVEGRVK